MKTQFYKIWSGALFLITLIVIAAPRPLAAANSVPRPTLWADQCIDTMKYSRDATREFSSDRTKAVTFIANEMAIIKSLGANCVAIDTPYDEEFIPVLQLWVNGARTNGLRVWFRGNFSGWEGWFNYPKLKSVHEHYALLQKFIKNHSDLLADGDIFTPAPEAENGSIIGNPWQSEQRKQLLRAFVVQSYQTCVQALQDAGQIGVRCGYFSVNGDVARDIYTPDTIKQTGGVVAIDHYIKTSQRMANDIDYLFQHQAASVFIGEFGAPIPDINGPMTEREQSVFIGDLLHVFYVHRGQVAGLNYWVLRGGSTSLLNDDGSLREAADTIRDYFIPGVIYGKVTDTLGRPLANAAVTTTDGVQTVVANEDGSFTMPLPVGRVGMTASADDFIAVMTNVDVSRGQDLNMTLALSPIKPNLWYKFRLLLQSFLKK